MNTDMMRKPYEILDGIANVELSIQNISRMRKELEENSIMVKAEVQKSVSQQLNALRQKEVQLLRQVDALISHQSLMLQLRLSKLCQILGRFKVASQWINRDGGHIDTVYLNDEDLSVSTCHLKFEPMQEQELTMAIERFGRFEAKGVAQNVFLLPEEEGYGDGDHHILHKTLQGESPNKIKVCFPKLSPKPEEWLLNSKQTMDDFDLCDTSSYNSDKTSSIDLLSHPDSEDSQMWIHVSEKGHCMCQDKGTVEIENLDSLACVPSSKPNTPSISIPSIPNICKSLSPKCTTFKECICEESCLVSNLREQLKKQNLSDGFQQQDCINKYVKEAYRQQEWLNTRQTENAEIKASLFKNLDNEIPNEWLDGFSSMMDTSEKQDHGKWLENLESPAVDVSNWLAADTNKKPDSEFKKSLPSMQKWLPETKFSRLDNSAWLSSSNSVSNVNEKSDEPEGIKKSEVGDVWLCTTNANRHAFVRQMYNLYFQNENVSWLAGQSLNGKEWLNS